MDTTGMKPYIGVKYVHAKPMTRGEYNKFKGSVPPQGEDQSVDGYIVRYPDGYASWCPQYQFESQHIHVSMNPELATDKPSVSEKMVEDFIDTVEVVENGPRTTIVKAVLKNGFVLVEDSSCVSPENYNSEIGIGICMEKIKDEIWANLGFVLMSAVNGVAGRYNAGKKEDK